MTPRAAPPPWLVERVIARIKALAGMELGANRFAQDGRLLLAGPRGAIDVRVSVLPGDRGEFAVLRLLSVQDAVPSLEALGVPAGDREVLLRAARAPDGLIVFAGPTGSGKTTSLHALLAAIDCERRNVVSIEDPVEIRSRRVRQIPVRPETGLDFAGVLRVVLRQDPDVILVGETRDEETAALVLQAALAGHLVLTTVHASSVFGVFERMRRLGVDPGALAEPLRVLASQRLVRRICGACGGQGCFPCEGSGLRGRTAVIETLALTPALRQEVRAGAGLERLQATAREAGYRSLLEQGRALVAAGVTKAEELERVLGEDAAIR